ncbi:M56 family metallopeptidase [Flavobacterium sp. 3HN19-14]|uniref:M56 family metallopeptidase n=1 Tax=Flavobacterium sp. 3HN19-14 TaxID=3448133 RepID=UPI003EE3E15A
MDAITGYIVKSAAILLLFSLVYIIFLRKETFFKTNRFFLLLGMVVSALLPLLSFTKIIFVTPVLATKKPGIAPSFIEVNAPGNTTEINWFLVLGIIYLLGFLFFTGQFVFDYFALQKVLSGKTIRKIDGNKIIETSEDLTPFSWFSYIVYNPSLYTKEELENILEHEKTHCRQWHSADVIFSRFFCIVFWFNPIVWLHKSMIIQNLEFIADSEASKINTTRKNYQITLLKVTAHENCLAFSNHFYQSLIKKRIVMLNKKQSNKSNLWKYGIVLPILTAFMLQFQVNVVAQEKIIEPKDKVNVDVLAVDIPPATTDEELESGIKKLGAVYGITIEFSGVKRDKNGNLIYIIATAKDKNGKLQKYATAANDGDIIEPFRFYIKNPDSKNRTFGFESITQKKTREAITNEKYYLDENNDTVVLAPKTDSNVTKKTGGYTMDFEMTNAENGDENQSTESDLKWEKMIYIINGKQYTNAILKDFIIQTDEDLKQLSPEEATKKYGVKGKYGALIFNGKSTFKKKEAVGNTKPRVIRIKNGEEVVFYADNRMKVPGEQSVIFKEDGPELIIDDVKQSNPEAAMKSLM